MSYTLEQKALPEGWRLIAVNAEFDNLMYWMDRCERKGHLENCSDLVEPWDAFDYNEHTPTPPRVLSELEGELLEALNELLIDMRLAQTNMRAAAKRDPAWEGCAEAIQPRVDAAIAAIKKAESTP